MMHHPLLLLGTQVSVVIPELWICLFLPVSSSLTHWKHRMVTCSVARFAATSRPESSGQEAGLDPYLQVLHMTAAGRPSLSAGSRSNTQSVISNTITGCYMAITWLPCMLLGLFSTDSHFQLVPVSTMVQEQVGSASQYQTAPITCKPAMASHIFMYNSLCTEQ